MPEQFEFAYNSKNFPFHDDYRWPHLAVCWGGDDVVLHVHCIRDEKRRLFSLMGFLDTDHVDQIVTVIHMAELNDAKVIMFRGSASPTRSSIS